jgi:hypothetical protein
MGQQLVQSWSPILLNLNAVIIVFLASNQTMGDPCDDWFRRGKVKAGPDCSIECSVLKTDMVTFNCPNQCLELCKSNFSEKMMFGLSELYPGLTPTEKTMASKNPSKLLAAYRLSWKAESICSKRFRTMETNDESDACRHFVWAALLTQEFGSKFAQQILDAHENEPTQPAEEKAIDLANNQRGVTLIRDLGKDKRATEEDLLKGFLKQLKEGKVVVLKPQTPKGSGP